MSHHRYRLEPYAGMSSRHHCPGCNHREKTFALYIDTETGEILHPSVGRCNRESNCGYHYTPKEYFMDNNIETPQQQPYKPRIKPQEKPPSFISVEVFKNSLNPLALEQNHFVTFLTRLFGKDITTDLISRYFIGTSKYWPGASVFWQIDTKGKIRTGKIMLYSPATGKRVKEPFNHITWAHKALRQPDFNLKQCFFGEHLLIDKIKPVAIVESEKTAVIASVYLPQFIWLAVGSLTNLNAEKCSILKGRNVTLFPDLKCFEKWSIKAKELSYLATFTVSDLLERKATKAEKTQGLDLADYLIRFDFREFQQPENDFALCTCGTSGTNGINETKKQPQPDPMEQKIKDLEAFFAGIELPSRPVKLNNFSTITDCSLFLDSHLATVKANKGNKTFLPYLFRLEEFKTVIIQN